MFSTSVWYTEGTQFKTRLRNFLFFFLSHFDLAPKTSQNSNALAGKLITCKHAYTNHGQQLLTLIPMAHIPTDSLWGWVIIVHPKIMTLQVFNFNLYNIDSSVVEHRSADP